MEGLGTRIPASGDATYQIDHRDPPSVYACLDGILVLKGYVGTCLALVYVLHLDQLSETDSKTTT